MALGIWQVLHFPAFDDPLVSSSAVTNRESYFDQFDPEALAKTSGHLVNFSRRHLESDGESDEEDENRSSGWTFRDFEGIGTFTRRNPFALPEVVEDVGGAPLPRPGAAKEPLFGELENEARDEDEDVGGAPLFSELRNNELENEARDDELDVDDKAREDEKNNDFCIAHPPCILS